MNPSVLVIARHDKQWSVSSEGEVLVLAETKQAAADLAKSAAVILRSSGSATQVKVAGEPRSFQAK